MPSRPLRYAHAAHTRQEAFCAEVANAYAFVIRRIGEHHFGVRHRPELETLSGRATDVTRRQADSQRRGVLPELNVPVAITGPAMVVSFYVNAGTAARASAISARTAMMPIFLVQSAPVRQ